MKLQGKNVTLRPITMDDIDNLLEWFNDPEVCQFITRRLPMQKESEEEWIISLGKRQDTNVTFMMETTDTQEALGTIGLGFRWIHRRAGFGIAIGNKEHWGKGIGTEATNLILDYAFNTLNLRKVNLEVLANNPRAIRCYEKCGFVKSGLLKEEIFVNGEYVDIVIMEVFKE